MTSGISLRRATPTDFDALLDFHRALYIAHRDRVVQSEWRPLYAYHDYEGTLRADVDAILRSPRARAWLADEAGRPVGYITGHIEQDPRRVLQRKGVVEDWYVEDARRGRGIGIALFQKLRDDFRSLGCEVVESATWPGNTATRRVHERLGFVEIQIIYRMQLDSDGA